MVYGRQYITLAKNKDFVLDSGKKFGPITVAFETYGKLNKEKTNCILIEHALTGDSHIARHRSSDKDEGWWGSFVGSSKIIDTNKYFVICSNVLGGCQGTTGPSSINGVTNRPYGLDFPIFTIRDIVNVQRELLRALGIDHLHCIIGGSMGGMQATEWAVEYPEFMDGIINIASPLSVSTEAIAINHIMRKAIMADDNFNKGDYYGSNKPNKGLSVARMLGMMTYQTKDLIEDRFSRKKRDNKQNFFQSFDAKFEIESYLNHQGDKFIDRFDANSYIYLTRALDLFDIAGDYGSIESAVRRISVPYLLLAINSDQLFNINEMRKVYITLKANGVDVIYNEIDSEFGHDSFLIEEEKYKHILIEFLDKIRHEKIKEVKISTL